MPSKRAQSAKGRRDMIIPPVVRGPSSEHKNIDVWEYSQTSGKIRGSLPQTSPEGWQRRGKQKQRDSPRFSTTFGVEIASTALMAPAPSRPGQGTLHIARQ